MLVPMKNILEKAKAEGYAVAAPNVNNEDTVRAAVQAAVENKAPVILDVAFGMTPDIRFLGKTVEYYAKEAPVPVALNLDHGATFEHVMLAIRSGFTSVMVDRSQLPFEQNVAEVSEVAHIAHSLGISVEAELGHVGSGAQYAIDRNAGLTDPGLAREFCERTGLDALAVAIGTAHGMYVGTPYLDFERLALLRKAVDVPLVLHGGSGTGDENLAQAARGGICKVNIATDLYTAGWLGLKGEMEDGKKPATRVVYPAIAKGYKQKLVHYMELFGQCGKA